jgi:iron complex outermembrane recepter protein
VKSKICTLAVVAIWAAQSHAQSAGSAPAASEPLGLDEIVVTAQRRSERLQDVPISVVALSSSDLSNAGVNSVRDLQNVVPGFTFSQFGTAPQPALRGVSTTLSAAGNENPIALYIDGVYYGAQTILENSFNDVDHLEVSKGPQGTLFGRNATGGAIQIFTKEPSFTPHGDITVDSGFYTGSADSHSAIHEDVQAFVTGPLIPDLVAGSLSGGYNYTPGYFTNAITGDREGFLGKGGFRGKLLFTPADGLKITASAYYIKNNDAGGISYSAVHGLSAAAQYPGTNPIATAPWTTLPGDEGVTSDFERTYGASLRIVYDASFGTITATTGYNSFHLLNTQNLSASDGPAACFLTVACLNYQVDQDIKDISQEVNFLSHEYGIFSFTGGLYYHKGWGGDIAYIQQTYFPGGVLVQDDSFDNSSYGIYSEGTFKFTDQLSLIVGLRYTIEPTENHLLLPGEIHSGTQTFDSTTPRVSLLYKITPDLNVYATYSQGFKSGESGATNQNAPVPFSSIAPEKLTAYELGTKFASTNVAANVAAFYYDYKNKQEQTFYGTSFYTSNTGPVVIYGLDLDTSVKLSHAFTIRGSASWIPTAKYKDFPAASGQALATVPFPPGGACAPFGGCGGYESGIGQTLGAFDATGKRLIRTPTATASTTLSYQDSIGNGVLDASTTLSYSSSYALEITDTLNQGGYASLAAQAGYKVDGTGLRLGVYGRNLTNRAYLTGQLISASGWLGHYEPPREIGISVNYGF